MFQLDNLSHIQDLLHHSRSIAVVGFSPKKVRPSNMVGQYLIDTGYTVFPVNPGQSEICGRKCYPNLAAVSQSIDIVVIFRKSSAVMPIVEEAVAVGAKAVWMQQGIINEQAAEFAEKAGLSVVMDRCIKIDHQNIQRPKGLS